MSRDMRFTTMWYVRPAQLQISLRICTVWSEPLLVACIFYECSATDWTLFGVSKLKRRLHMLVWVYTCKNTTLLEITSHGSNGNFLFLDIVVFKTRPGQSCIILFGSWTLSYVTMKGTTLSVLPLPRIYQALPNLSWDSSYRCQG